MANPNTITGLAFTVALLTAGQAPAQDGPRTVVLHVENYARLGRQTLERAEAEAARVYTGAGIRTVWVHGDDEPGATDPDALHLRVLLLCDEMTKMKTAAEQIGSGVLGRAARPTGRAYIFTPRVANAALKHSRRLDTVLGRVLAHEVGHMLLPSGHSATGIMKADLNPASDRFEPFTAPQVATLQLVLNR